MNVLVKILEMSISASFLIAVVLIIRGIIFKKIPKWLLCLLWTIVGIRLLIPFTIESEFSVIPNFSVMYNNSQHQSNIEVSAEVELSQVDEIISDGNTIGNTESSFDINHNEESQFSFETEDGDNSSFDVDESENFELSVDDENKEDVSQNIILSPEESISGEESAELVSEIFKNDAPQDQDTTNAPGDNVSNEDKKALKIIFSKKIYILISVVWLLGVIFLTVHGLIKYIKLKKKVSVFDTCKDGIKKSKSINSPFVLGVIKPCIYLPFNLSEKSEKYIVAHEKAHIKRLDHITKIVAYIALTVHWFNPLVWVTFVLLSKDIEYACDEKVLKSLNAAEKKEYALALLECSIKGSVIAACPVTFGEIGVKERIKNMMSYKKPLLWIVILVIAVCLVLSVMFLTHPKNNNDNSEEMSEIQSISSAESDEKLESLEASEYSEVSEASNQEDQSDEFESSDNNDNSQNSSDSDIDNSTDQTYFDINIYVKNKEDYGFMVQEDKTDGSIDDIILKLIGYECIPQGTKALSFSNDDKAIKIDLSKDFENAFEMGFDEEMPAISLFNTLIDFYDAESLSFTIEGKTFNSEFVTYDFPIKFTKNNTNGIKQPHIDISGKATYTGTCGKNLKWKHYGNGTVVIYGKGEMYENYKWSTPYVIKQLKVEYGVTGIYGFYDMHIEKISLPDTLVSIGDISFTNCPKLKEIVIPSSVKTIGEFCFQNCASLEKVVINDAAVVIGDHAFENCASLKSVSFGNATREIGLFVFSDCINLDNIKLPDSVEAIYGQSFNNTAFYNNSSNWVNGFLYSGNHLLKAYGVSGKVTVKQGTKTISPYAFSDQEITEVVLPESVSYIGTCAFLQCFELEKINIPRGIKVIHSRTFQACYELDNVVIGNNVEKIGQEAFSGCNLSNIEFGKNITIIEVNAFETCKIKGVLELPQKLKTIGEGAFSYCKDITEVKFGNSLETIEKDAFFYCSAIKKIDFGASLKTIGIRAFGNCTSIESIALGNSVLEIKSSAFNGCSSLNKISLGNNIEFIGGEAFTDTSYYKNASNWENGALYLNQYLIRVDENVVRGSYSVKEGTTFIASHAFEDCVLTEEITLPASLKKIGAYSFASSDLIGLEFVIPETVKEIGEYAFIYSSVKKVVIPSSVKRIPESAFSRCQWLEEIVLPDTLVAIEKSAFSGCQSLEEIVLPDTLVAIEESAFSGCHALSNINIPNSVTEIGEYAFKDCNFKTIVLPDSLKKLSKYIFENCSSLENIKIPDSVVEIGGCAFYMCRNLKNVELGKSLVTIKSRAFSECTSLFSIYIPASVKNLKKECLGYTSPGEIFISSFKIRGKKGSSAELYAKENKFTFVEE